MTKMARTYVTITAKRINSRKGSSVKHRQGRKKSNILKYSGKYGLIKHSHKAESSFLPKIKQGMPLDTGLKPRGHARSLNRDKTLLFFCWSDTQAGVFSTEELQTWNNLAFILIRNYLRTSFEFSKPVCHSRWSRHFMAQKYSGLPCAGKIIEWLFNMISQVSYIRHFYFPLKSLFKKKKGGGNQWPYP